MLEITNRNKFPIQLIVKSSNATKSFTTLNIPGIGAKKNIYLLKEEKATENIYKAERDGLISIKHIPDKIRKGE